MVSIKVESEVVCALSNGDITGDLGWPPKSPNFYILRCLSYLRIADKHRDFKFGVRVGHSLHSKSQPTEDQLYNERCVVTSHF